MSKPTIRNMNGDATTFEYYAYHPSMGAAVLFVILFTIITSVHGFQMLRNRLWFMIPFFIGGILEVIGYIGRTISASQNPGPYSNGPYIVQTIAILIAPALLAASIYMILGRVVLLLHGESELFLRRTWLTKIFVTGDILSFLTQGAGGGFLASTNRRTSALGSDIVVGGLLLQVVSFGLFVASAGIFHWRITRHPTTQALGLPWKKHMLSLYAVSLLIFVRSIVRVVEFRQGFTGYVISHEWYLYVFDATLMWTAMVIVSVVQPAQVKRLLAEDQELVRKETGEAFSSG